MSQSFPDQLSRFTPDGTGLDRDRLLFAAGQRSARRGRWWSKLAGLLAVSQVLTLVLLWPRPERSPPPNPAPLSTFPDSGEPPSPGPIPEETGILTLSRRLLQESGNRASDASDALVPDSPPLRAFAAPPPSLVN